MSIEEREYYIVIDKDPESCYGASFPDVPGCFSGGNTFSELQYNAQEALSCHLWGSFPPKAEYIPKPGEAVMKISYIEEK